MAIEYTYSTKQTEKGLVKYRHWTQKVIDEADGSVIPIERKEPIELDGKPLRWYSSSEINKMSKSQRERILV